MLGFVMKKNVFKNFQEYWFYAKFLSSSQRDVILSSLSDGQKTNLIKSYKEGGWEDLVIHNEIDKILEGIEKDLGINLVLIHCQIMANKKVYIKKSQWDYIEDLLRPFKSEHTYYVLGRVKSEIVGEDSVLLFKGN